MSKKNTQSSYASAVVSPSRITDYFEASKTKGKVKGNRKKSEAIQDTAKSSSSSVYLTPESSPGNGHDSTNLQDVESEIVSNSSESEKQRSNDYSEPSPNVADAKPKVNHSKSTSSSAPSKTKKSSKKDKDVDDIPKKDKSTSVKSQASSSSTKDEETLAEASSVKEEFTYTVEIVEDNTSASPSIPRLKLRKGRLHTDKVAASADAEPIKPKPNRRKKKEPASVQSTTIKDFFPVRRSGRQTKSEIEKQKQDFWENLILSGCEHGLEVCEFSDKGRGVVATKDFDRGDFVIEYAGELLSIAEAEEREAEYGKDPSIGCYMYYFQCGTKKYCVDATAESGRLGRLINHSLKGNLTTRALMVKDTPRLVLVAAQKIKAGEELSYDYGDRNKQALEAHPWLKL